MTAIALIGAPGSGKSTVGPLLARRLQTSFVDVDSVIEDREGRLVREIFADEGEPYFRDVERRVTLELLGGEGVVSLGGGAPLTPEIATALAAHPTVWLQVDAHHAARRIGLGSGRPLLAGGGVRATLIKLLNARTPAYEAVARHAVETSGRQPEAVADEIVTLVQADTPQADA